MIKIHPICAFNDNYIWMIINVELNEVIIVDPGDALPVIAFLNQRELKLIGIFVTHKHNDHTGGVNQLLGVYPGTPVYAHEHEALAFTTHLIKDGDLITPDQWQKTFKVLHIPGHTLGHVAFYTDGLLLTGDTLFSGGCGRLFEGTATQMLTSLEKLAALPNDTLLYCGHEYTLSNLHFALKIEPQNIDIQRRLKEVEILRSKNQPTLPSTIKIEKAINPFLRCTEKSVISAVEAHVGKKLIEPVDVFYELRQWKNSI